MWKTKLKWCNHYWLKRENCSITQSFLKRKISRVSMEVVKQMKEQIKNTRKKSAFNAFWSYLKTSNSKKWPEDFKREICTGK